MAPEESCLVIDTGADIYQRNGLGRVIEQEEALDILAPADDAGLVLQPGNSKTPMNSRGIFDEETRRNALAFAADASLACTGRLGTFAI